MGLKHTAFHSLHEKLGAKLVNFAGFEMPVQYAGIMREHKRVRESVGLFDVSHMGEIEVWGHDAPAFVQGVTVNDVTKLSDGKIQYSVMCYEDGGIIDDLLIYHLGSHYMLVVNASNIDKDVAWLEQHVSGDVKVKNRSDDVSLLAVQGPQSMATLQKLTMYDLSTIQYYTFVQHKLAGIDMIISRTGYTGELGFELYFPSDEPTGRKVWSAILEAGNEFEIGPVGLGARDTLRLEMGFCLYGNDIDGTTHPFEAGLGWLTKLEKGPFVGRDSLVRAKQEGLRRRLVGFSVAEKAFPRHGYTIQRNGRMIGKVTSGTFSPSLDRGIGMGYVEVAQAKAGTGLQIAIRDRMIDATVGQMPFLKR